MKPYLYSIIVVNYNGGSLLLDCLDHLHRFSSDFELILIDNNSHDGSTEKSLNRYPRTRVFRNNSNVGFAKANNVGIKAATGDWIILLNPDTRVTKGWLEALKGCAETGQNVGLVTPKLVRMDGKTIDSAGHRFRFDTGITSDRGSGELDTGQYDDVEDIPSCSFACVMIRRSILSEVGLLDERMLMYFEDLDFCIRARVAGWNVRYCPTSVVLHFRSALTPLGFTKIQRRAVAYRLRVMLKCYELQNMFKLGIARALRDLLSSLAGIKNKDLQYSIGYIQSPVWNLIHFPIRERIFVQSTRRVPDKTIATV